MSESNPSFAKPRDGLSFIHSSLDDAGLSPADFRIYCHINRAAGRAGVCNQALSRIAAHCGYCDEITRASLKKLTELSMLSRNYIPGKGTEYRLTSPEKWKAGAQGVVEQNSRGAKKSHHTPTENSQHYPSEKVAPKGIHFEGIPKKVLKPDSNKGTLAPLTMNPKTRITVELMDLCRTALGQAEMSKPGCHRRWLDRAEKHPWKLRRVLTDTADADRMGEIKTTPAQYAEHRWKEFA